MTADDAQSAPDKEVRKLQEKLTRTERNMVQLEELTTCGATP